MSHTRPNNPGHDLLWLPCFLSDLQRQILLPYAVMLLVRGIKTVGHLLCTLTTPWVHCITGVCCLSCSRHLINKKTNDRVISVLQCVYSSPHPSVPSTLLICYQVALLTAPHRTAREADNDLAQSRSRSSLLPPESSPPLWFLSPSHP